MIAPRTTLLSTLLLALGLVACKTDEGKDYGNVSQDDAPKAYADLYCELLATCDCDFSIPADQCVDQATAQFQGSFDEAAAAGLTYHGECLGAYLEYIDGLGCKTVSELTADPDFAEFNPFACKTFSGDAGEGEACVSFLEVFGDSCQQGLACFDDTCSAISTTPQTKQLGETCDPQTEICVDGAICAGTVDDPLAFSCVPLPALGESCQVTGLCEDGSWCDFVDFTCKAPLGEGESCAAGGSEACSEGLYCEDVGQTCIALLTEGTPCMYDSDCAEGLACDAPDGGADVCVPEGPLVCGG